METCCEYTDSVMWLPLLQSAVNVVEDCPACQAGNEREAAGGGGKESAKGTGTAAFV